MIVKHPGFPNVTRDVENPSDWVEQGWLLDEPPAPPKPRPKPRRQKFPRI